jgi:hypothetical protein
VVVGAAVVLVVILFRRRKAPPPQELKFNPLTIVFNEVMRAGAVVEGSDLEEMLVDEHGADD